jgi:hypothetical protein
MARVIFDRSAPTGFLVVRKGGRVDREQDTLLVQNDYEYPAFALAMGWPIPCTCGSSDGTIDCEDCNVTAAAMIASALAWIETHEGERFDALDEYFEGDCVG